MRNPCRFHIGIIGILLTSTRAAPGNPPRTARFCVKIAVAGKTPLKQCSRTLYQKFLYGLKRNFRLLLQA
jgi:hypothetical protein